MSEVERSSTELYDALQMFKQYVQANFPYKATIFEGLLDPSVTGVAAPIPSFYAQKDGAGVLLKLWSKFGSTNTDWSEISMSQAKTLIAGTNITLDEGPTTITINSSGGSGGVQSITNVGIGLGLYKETVAGVASFKSLYGGNNLNITNEGNWLVLDVYNVATLDISGKVPTSQLPDSLIGSVNYRGTWNANAGTTPTATPAKGDYYVVNVAGSYNLSGITDWKIGDWAIYNGTVWEKVDNTEAVTSVFGRTGAVTAVSGDYSAFYQPIDATLTALAGTATGSDALIYFTGVDTTSTTNFTAFGRTLVGSSNAAAALTTIGAIAASSGTDTNTTLNTPTFAGYKELHANTTTNNSTFQVDLSFTNSHQITFGADCALSFTGAVDMYASSLTLILRQDATGGRVITFPASVKWEGGVAPTLSTTSNAVDIITMFTVDGGVTIYAGLAIKGAA